MADRLKRMRSGVHRDQWAQTLRTYAYPVIGLMPVDQIETDHVLKVLKPHHESKCETMARLRGRIERIIARATVEGLRRGANPATWRGHLQEALPPRSEVQPVKHFRAMDYKDVPAFMAELGQISAMSAISLRYTILTAARAGQVVGARWSEIDRHEQTWKIPACRTNSVENATFGRRRSAAVRERCERIDQLTGQVDQLRQQNQKLDQECEHWAQLVARPQLIAVPAE